MMVVRDLVPCPDVILTELSTAQRMRISISRISWKGYVGIAFIYLSRALISLIKSFSNPSYWEHTFTNWLPFRSKYGR